MPSRWKRYCREVLSWKKRVSAAQGKAAEESMAATDGLSESLRAKVLHSQQSVEAKQLKEVRGRGMGRGRGLGGQGRGRGRGKAGGVAVEGKSKRERGGTGRGRGGAGEGRRLSSASKQPSFSPSLPSHFLPSFPLPPSPPPSPPRGTQSVWRLPAAASSNGCACVWEAPPPTPHSSHRSRTLSSRTSLMCGPSIARLKDR